MSSTRILMLYTVISVFVQILSCANSRSVIGSNPRIPFLDSGLRERDGGYEESSLVYFGSKHENQPVGLHSITSHSSMNSGFHRLHDPPWSPVRILESHSMDIGHPMSAETAPRITSQTNRKFSSSFQHNDDLLKRLSLQDAFISLEDISKDTSSQDLFEKIQRKVSNKNWISVDPDQAFLKLQALFDGSEEEGQRCVQEELWEKYGEHLKRRFQDCDFFLEDDQSRWRRYIARIPTCGKGWRRVKRSCRTVYANHY